MKSSPWDSAARSHRGSVRSVNEDAFLNEPNAALWCVADGMGGHSKGDLASRLIVDKLADLSSESTSLSTDSIKQAIYAANAEISTVSKQLGEKVGSTVAVLFIECDLAHVLWAGDSRVYRFSNNELVQLSCDHNQAQELMALGLLAPEQVQSHPGSRLLTRAVGTNSSLHVEHITIKWDAKDTFILCTDGLNEVMEAPSIVSQLSNTQPSMLSELLINKALNSWALDNVTVISVVTC